jgi:2,5-dihydroxypyridine 5,6-dioxygenase
MLVPNQAADIGSLTNLFRRALQGCGVEPGETVAVLTNPQSPTGYADAVVAAAGTLGARVFTIGLPAIARASTTVPGVGEVYGVTGLTGLGAAIQACQAADLVVDLAILLHSAEQEQILAAGTRMLMITEPPEIIERMFPSDDLRRRVLHSVDLLNGASELVIRSEGGTDITMGLGQYRAGGGWGFTRGPGTHAHLTAGLVATYPTDGAVEGTWVIDAGDIIFPFKTYVRDRITIRVSDGFVRSIDGAGADAELYRDYLESWGDPEGFAMSHIGWGLNEKARWSALALLDRFATQGMDGRCFAGNVLFSTGPNNEAGGKRFTLAHSDVPVRRHSVWLDGRQIIAAGQFVVDELKVDNGASRLGGASSLGIPLVGAV